MGRGLGNAASYVLMVCVSCWLVKEKTWYRSGKSVYDESMEVGFYALYDSQTV